MPVNDAMWRAKRGVLRSIFEIAGGFAVRSFSLHLVTFRSRFEFKKNIEIIMRFEDNLSSRTKIQKIVLIIKIIKPKERRGKKVRVDSDKYRNKLDIYVAIV